jgi:hypothetical protein
MSRRETASAMEDDPREPRSGEHVTNVDAGRQSGGERSGRASHYDRDVDELHDDRQSER